MTVDSELRRIWRKDLGRLEERLIALQAHVAKLELEISVHHPSIGLVRKNTPARPPESA